MRPESRLSKYLTWTLVVVLVLFLLVVTTYRQNTTDISASSALPTPLASEVLLNVGDSVTVDGSDCALRSHGNAQQVIVTCYPFPSGYPSPAPVFVATPVVAP